MKSLSLFEFDLCLWADVPFGASAQVLPISASASDRFTMYANTLFGILAVIEFAWSAAVMLLEKTDLQSWTSALIRKLMWIGAFYALLINGRIWIPAIIDSFSQIGANAAGMAGPLSPGDVFVQGLNIAGALIDAGSTSAFFTNPGTSFALVLCALLIAVSYIIITLNFIVTMVESYLVVSVGFIFLGFGGSRWTVPYTERYIGLAISIGIKIVLLYCLDLSPFLAQRVKTQNSSNGEFESWGYRAGSSRKSSRLPRYGN